MANSSLDEIVKKYPIEYNFLQPILGRLQDAERVYMTDESGDETCRKSVLRLLSVLHTQDAAFNIPTKTRNQDVASGLEGLFTHLRQCDFNYNHYRPLVRLVLEKAPDTDIWRAVLDLIGTRETTPSSVPPSFDATPVRFTSSSQKGSEQTRRLVEGRIFEEIRGCTFRDVGGFFAKYFEGKDWSARVDAICQRILESEWAKFPDPPVQDAVLDWWLRFQNNFLSDARGVYFLTMSKKDLVGSEAERQVDLLLKARPQVQGDSGEKHDWKDIRVVGELKKSSDEIRTKGTLLQLARYVREVFIAQPARQFVHAFAVCGTKMEAWVFDRSGPYSSGVFDVYKDSEQFFRIVLGYAMMSDEELGLDTFTTPDRNASRTITVNGSEIADKILLRLDPTPLCSQYAIVCRGTTCFLAKNSDKVEGVAKFSWTSDKRRPEVDLLQLAYQRGVQGIARVLGYRTIISIADLRRGLTFGNPHTFQSRNTSAASSLAQSQSRCKLSRSLTRKRRSPDTRPHAAKRSRSSSQQPKAKQFENELTFTVESVHTPSLFDKDDEVYDNRILRCLVVSPAGRPIYEYKSPLELLMALQDAIKAHRSLYLDGKILHRDVSENNIIITDPNRVGGRSGMLIDLDLAKEVGSGRSGARHQTGTMEFMAIEVLLNVDHTYRHDLESFFYVLIWQCACHGWRKSKQGLEQPKNSLLKRWYTGSYEEIATYKRGNMEAGGFERILMKEFPPCFDCVKPLCRAIRDILFPYGKKGLIVGTPQDPKRLYGPIIKAYEDTIALLEAGKV
ncbi:uncharacterized protein CIMG_05059 [Coccidioides immitis RS]|uniref:Protein kinase domain-containing protein n=2 Tax=Coccidioides immitis TaxID=5501 RepID=A0A0E1RZ57_COCIM|nr:uncharacterized protein CIMG_05059 [Coccidioides immitis RS]EAS34035.2 hypothetical protein CIMG_05059 [Coccidioides immitis RS]KMP05255.1 hypothetical protein CIRG_04936 [Coccidioides immitis RMSCC 2394]TPX21632.1 hypothetical protein DIZ76_015591 [Coccidioides immitis]